MLNRIKKLFEELNRPDSGAEVGHSFPEKEMAACALMIEAATLDGNLCGDELEAIKAIAIRSFGLDNEETAALIAEATRAQDSSNQLVRFTRAIKEHYDVEERVEIIEMLWEVVYADGVLHEYEDNLLRRIGGLIYVPDRERGEARKRVMARLGIAAGR